MDIYIIEFNKDNNKDFKNIPKKYSRVILKFLLNKIYNNDDEILENNGKPYVKSDLYFSISHSNNILVIAFDKAEIGIDIEYLKPRNYKKILNYMGAKCENEISQEEFYKIWTIYEAEYKSNMKQNIMSFKYQNYICSVSSLNKNKPVIYEVKIPQNKISEIELMNLKLVKDNAKNENSVVAQEINIASSDFLPLPTLKIE